MFEIVDGVLPKELIARISEGLTESIDIPWFKTNTASANDKGISFNFSFSAPFDAAPPDLIDAYKIISKQKDTKNLIRIRCGLIMRDKEKTIHSAHVDLPSEHKTALLYICGDGNTIFYDQTYELSSEKTINKFIEDKQLEVFAEVKPKNNRVVIFDGLRYHSSSTPEDMQFRIAINFNYKEE
jgi:hypothetical protein